MVTELQELMRANVAAPPPDRMDLAGLVADGRARVRGRRRRRTAVGAAAAAVAAVVAVSVLTAPGGGRHAEPARTPPAPDAPTVHLADAQPAVEGRDYDVLASHTNDNLDRDNGQYFDGVTNDGLVLYRDGPRSDQLWPRFALMDPATGEKDWLPKLAIGQNQTWPVSLTQDRLVLMSTRDDTGEGGTLVAHVFDRVARAWSTMTWPALADVESYRTVAGPDGRLYIGVPASQGRIPEGGWPTDSSGEADDADAEGDTYHLWSVSLSDAQDVRDEGLTFGSLAFTPSSMVWTDSTNGAAGRVHVRDLSSGEEHSFDPHAGDRCNLLSFGATDDRIVMGEYCGTYDHGVRDDRVQVLTTDGEQVTTIQDSGLDGAIAGTGGVNGLVVITAYPPDAEGTYLYDLGTDRLIRVSDAIARFAMGGPVPAGQFVWTTPVNHRHGATQWLGEVRQ
ncbi:MAG: hypothetical protein H6529_07600 [Nocardioides sp.]|nr:hypothetical protein [Nocardioidaceae bacterium]MCB8956334.1 hypothetical protein [Nocardioides sp.]